jgi:hypothetical protein
MSMTQHTADLVIRAFKDAIDEDPERGFWHDGPLYRLMREYRQELRALSDAEMGVILDFYQQTLLDRVEVLCGEKVLARETGTH